MFNTLTTAPATYSLSTVCDAAITICSNTDEHSAPAIHNNNTASTVPSAVSTVMSFTDKTVIPLPAKGNQRNYVLIVIVVVVLSTFQQAAEPEVQDSKIELL